MKKTLIGLTVLIILAGGPYLLPANRPIAEETLIAQDAETTYSYLMNLENWSQWIAPNNQEVIFDGTPGVVGSSVRWQGEPGIKITLIHLKGPNYVQFVRESLDQPEDSQLEYITITGQGNETLVQWVVQQREESPWRRINLWLGSGPKENIKRDLAALKKGMTGAGTY